LPVNYSYREDKNLLSTTASGDLTVIEVLQYLESIIGNSKIGRGFVEVVNLEQIDDITLTYRSLNRFPELWTKYVEKGCAGTIIIAQSDLAFGMMRMVQTVASASNNPQEISFDVCRSSEEADTVLASIRAKQSTT